MLNKIDLSPPEKLDETEKQITQLDKFVTIARAKNSDIDFRRIFNLGRIDFAHKLEHLMTMVMITTTTTATVMATTIHHGVRPEGVV